MFRNVFILVLVLGVMAGIAQAALVLVENFDSMATGNIDGRTCTGVLGGTWDTQSANTGNVVVEDNSGSRVVRFMSTSSGGGRGVGFNSITDLIEDSETGMAFFRFMIRTDAQVPRTYMGLISDTSDDPINSTNTDTPTNIPVGFGLVDDSSGGFNLVKTDGTTVLKAGLVRAQWYNVWIEANNAADTFDLYLSTATGPAGAPALPTSGDLVAGTIPFGVATSDPLTGMIFASPTGTVQSSRCYIDEIYMTPEPATLVLLGLGGLSLLRARKKR